METTTDTQKSTKLDIEQAFTFVFKDPKWIEKVAIGAALMISFIGGPAVMGWGLEIQKRVQDEQDDILPEWNDIGGLFIDGLKFWLVNLVWFLPAWILMLPMMIPYLAMPFLITTADDPSGIHTFLFTAMVFIPYLMMPISLILSFLMYTFMPVISGNYLETRELKDAFNVKRVFALVKANFWLLLAASFLAMLGAQVIGMVGMMLCFVGLFLVSPITQAIMYHFFGQAYRISKIKLAAKEAAAADDNTSAELTA